ncbi:hypothetical protein GBA52_007080 [Prunus armeniaca]|nr:hypothetical protein GBA52_007080 [Prunus armeniaca]
MVSTTQHTIGHGADGIVMRYKGGADITCRWNYLVWQAPAEKCYLGCHCAIGEWSIGPLSLGFSERARVISKGAKARNSESGRALRFGLASRQTPAATGGLIRLSHRDSSQTISSPGYMAHRLLRNVEADGWERSDFPIICESCLGDNPYVRMTRADYDKECKICTRPFTVFRWRPGRDARFKKSEICQTCSKLKNVCQVCLLDLEYGLPVQVRDTALAISSNDAIPKSDVNREFFAEEHDRKARAGIDYESSYGKARPSDTILKLQRTTPYYKRNRAHVCSFYIRGECTRGAECPYRHEMPITGELSQQNIKDRYYGVNDPVAMKLLNKAGEMPSLEPPEMKA